MTIEKITITHSEEYKSYIKALCRLASGYVPKIRHQFAEKAFENYENETIRKLVLEYGKEVEKLDADRLRDFEWCANEDEHFGSLEDSCLNKAESYGHAIKFLFNI